MKIYSFGPVSLVVDQEKCPFVVVPNVKMRFNIVFSYIIMHLTIELPKTAALLPWYNDQDMSICTKTVAETMTREVPYEETYWRYILMFRKQKSRINYKVEYYKTYHLKEECCKGYKQISNRCTPICSPDCKNGTCKTPNLCECNQGYQISTNETNVCTPTCLRGCINGDCVKPEVCKCYPNYWLDSDGYTCRPTCEKVCEANHGYCLVPNNCICRNGYQKSNESSICEPICERKCINGKCIEPNVCGCHDGHELNITDSYICKPKCKEMCMFGTCTAPDVCSCNEGYMSSGNNNRCKPICSRQCVMGMCIAPEICGCIDGYALAEKSMHVCEPICEHACSNGTCTAPNTCKCDEGFVLDDNDLTRATCKPFCTYPCDPSAECTAPDRCTCLEGYRVVDENDTVWNSNNITCIPVCEDDCTNGKCIAPNICACDEGYYMTHWLNVTNDKYFDYCQPICEKRCDPNGRCDAPNSCVCDEGYHNETGNDDYVCQPFCQSDCGYGTCTAPNVCTCDTGYELDERGRCVPICYPSCTNGTCIKPDVCSCKEGFVLQNQTICEPICESLCSNGTCIAPNTCQCDENFVEMKSNNVSDCVSACSRNCSGRGTCYNEGSTCLCFFGWTGWDCNEASVCVYKTTRDLTTLPSSVTVINETNSTLMENYNNAPLCYQCSDSLDNDTLCLALQSDESLTIPTVGCFLSTELPCYKRPHHNALKRFTGMTVSLIGSTIVIIVILALIGYVIVHKRQKRTIVPESGQVSSLDPIETEALILTRGLSTIEAEDDRR